MNLSEIKQWFLSKEPHEKRLLISAGSVMAVLLVYTLIWAPISNGIEKKRVNVIKQRDVLAWMSQAAIEIKSKEGAVKSDSESSKGKSLLAVVDTSAREERLRDMIKRVEPEGNNEVKIWFEEVPFDLLIKWLDTIARKQGVHVVTLTVQEQKKAGMVNARTVLAR